MRLSLLFFATLVASQNFPGIPPCASPCSTLSTIAGISACRTLSVLPELSCACQNTAFVQGVASCAARLCPADQVQSAYITVSSLCSGIGVTLGPALTIQGNSTSPVVLGSSSGGPASTSPPTGTGAGSASPGLGSSSSPTASTTSKPAGSRATKSFSTWSNESLILVAALSALLWA